MCGNLIKQLARYNTTSKTSLLQILNLDTHSLQTIPYFLKATISALIFKIIVKIRYSVPLLQFRSLLLLTISQKTPNYLKITRYKIFNKIIKDNYNFRKDSTSSSNLKLF